MSASDSGGEENDDVITDPMATLLKSTTTMRSFVGSSSRKSLRVNSVQSDVGYMKGPLDNRKSEVDLKKRRASKRHKRRENHTETCNVGCSFGPFGGGSNNNSVQMALADKGEKKNDKKKTADKKKEKESAKQKQKLLQKTQLVKDTMLNKKDQLQKLVKQDERKRMDDFESQRLLRVRQRQEAKLQKMNLPVEAHDAIVQNEEMCCEQCLLPVPLLCWRYKLRFLLNKGRIMPD